MTLVPYTRRWQLPNLRTEMDDLFGSFFDYWPVQVTEPRFMPAVDIREDEKEIIVKAEIPGCKAEDIEIDVNGNLLTISGEKKLMEESKEKGMYCSERVYGSFRREISLPSDIMSDKVSAVSRDGILTITLPKAEKSKSAKIQVREE